MRIRFFFLLVAATAIAPAQDLIQVLQQLPHVTEVKRTDRSFEITFEQPVDHKNPKGPKFGQHLYLSSTNPNYPVILGTEGYSAGRVSGGELSRIIPDANVLTVEHRYFGKSIPSPCDWKHLTIKNAADDMHAIVTAFKTLYKGKWVSTGASKGGQTALYFKSYYPNDVDATVAYVAPINVAQEDPRIYAFFRSVGDQDTRDKIRDFQIALLKRQSEVIPLLKMDPAKFSMGVTKAYEMGVLEFPFAMWQYGTKPIVPAPDASAQELADAYNKINAQFYYSDSGVKMFEAFQYQAFTEIGYYNYDITDFKPYLKTQNITNMDLCPAGTKDTIVYNPSTLAFVYNYLQYKADNVIYIYGETDPWSATQVELIGRTNAVKAMVKGAWHNADIRLASPAQKDEIYAALEKWLGMKLNRV